MIFIIISVALECTERGKHSGVQSVTVELSYEVGGVSEEVRYFRPDLSLDQSIIGHRTAPIQHRPEFSGED